MKNPWLDIPYADYENHMAEVGQTQVLNKLVENALNKEQPQKFALLGCATGNGLEHIQPNITKEVHAIDINPTFLEKTKEKFDEKINLHIHQVDIENDELPVKEIDLFFVGLVLEYVKNPETALSKIIDSLSERGKLLLIIQKSKQTSIITKTKYSSLQTLSTISKEVNENEISIILEKKLSLVDKEEIALNSKKSFLVLYYNKNTYI